MRIRMSKRRPSLVRMVACGSDRRCLGGGGGGVILPLKILSAVENNIGYRIVLYKRLKQCVAKLALVLRCCWRQRVLDLS